MMHLSKPVSDPNRLLHMGIRDTGKKPVCAGFIIVTAQATGLVLCTHGTLRKGTLRMYPSLRVPTHPFRVLGLSVLGKYLGEFSVCKYQGLTAMWCDPT